MFPCPTSPPQGPGCQPGGLKLKTTLSLHLLKMFSSFLTNPLSLSASSFFPSLCLYWPVSYLSLLSPFLLLYAAFVSLLFSVLSSNLLCVCDLGHVTLALSEPQLSHLQNEAVRLTGLYNALAQIWFSQLVPLTSLPLAFSSLFFFSLLHLGLNCIFCGQLALGQATALKAGSRHCPSPQCR